MEQTLKTPGTKKVPDDYERPRIVWSDIAILVLLTFAAVARVAATYPTFNQTMDEPFQIAAGMELLDHGTYTYELVHPPLPRVAAALGPYLSGLHWPGSPSTYEEWRNEGNVILSSGGNYRRSLTLARLGMLPFLVLACATVYLWAHRWFGRVAAVLALVLFICLPPILGQALQTTTDMPVAAAIAASLYLFIRWIERPEWLFTSLLGIAFGAAFASKFSAIAFLPACVGAAVVYLALVKRHRFGGSQPVSQYASRFALAMFLALACVWGAYGFGTRPISPLKGSHVRIDKLFGNSWLRQVAYRAVETPVPLLDFYDGINAQTVRIAKDFGYDSYLLGEYRNNGWWYFFPVVFGVKTPIGFLLLACIGLAVVLLAKGMCRWQQTLTAIFPLVVFLSSMTSDINSGVRHILPVYPALAVLGGYAAARLAEGSRRWIAVAGLSLVVWVAADSAVAHPDYISYFNPIASAHPEKVLSESDLDWGQDLLRLGARLHQLDVTSVTMKYFGSASLDIAALPPHQELSPTIPASGWVAISIHYLELEHAKDGSYDWLRRYRPLERVGRSIFLYSIP